MSIFTDEEIKYMLSLSAEDWKNMKMKDTAHPLEIRIDGVPHLLRVDTDKEGKETLTPVPESEIKFES